MALRRICGNTRTLGQEPKLPRVFRKLVGDAVLYGGHHVLT